MSLDSLEELFLYCPACARQSLAEAPPCPDGHGPDCPDRACVACGTALLLDGPAIGLITPRLGATARRAA